MEKQPEALLLADALQRHVIPNGIHRKVAAELRRLRTKNELLMNALWKACGDDEEVVKATIESQR
jgi:hypothetical protein